MPIFAHIETEAQLQINDRTRLDASKSHTSLNQPAFTMLTIQPGSDAIPISVYSSDKNRRYLDWEFSSWSMDIDSTNNKIDFKESAGDLVATIPDGTYTLSALAAEISTQMDAAIGSLNTYTTSVNADNELTITSSASFSLLNGTGVNKNVSLLRQLYFGLEDLEDDTSYESGVVESLQKKIICYAGENKYQVQTITCVADVSDSLNSKYFFIYGDEDALKYYVWYDTGAGVDPLITGYTGVQVVISTNDTATAVATATATQLNLLAEFSASSNLAEVAVTNATYGWNSPAAEGLGTGFTFEVDTQGEAQDSDSTYINIYSVEGDYLYSNDQELVQFEPDIRRWIPEGRNSFLNVHRQAQREILDYLDRNGFTDINGNKYNKFDLLDRSDVNEWSRYAALRMIFEGITVSREDVYNSKRQIYDGKEANARNRMTLSLDKTKTKTKTKTPLNHSVGLFRS